MEIELPTQQKNRLELKLLKEQIKQAKENLHCLSEKAERISSRMRIAEDRFIGKRDDEERMRKINEESKKTAVKHYYQWCEIDELFVLENKSRMTFVEMAKYLGRTHKSIKAKICTLKKREA